MNYKILIKSARLLGLGAALCFTLCVNAQSNRNTPRDPKEIERLRKVVEGDFRNTDAHQQYLAAVGATTSQARDQYEKWNSLNPSTEEIPMALAQALMRQERPELKEWAERALKINPRQAEALSMLGIEAELNGDQAKKTEYMKRAKEANPQSADYALYYAMCFEHTDVDKFRKLMIGLADEFPGSERGALGIYWAASSFTDTKRRAETYELLRSKYRPDLSSISGSGMSQYHELLLKENPAKATELADFMLGLDSLRGRNEWTQRKKFSQLIVDADELARNKKFPEAISLLKSAPIVAYSSSKELLMIRMAKATLSNGDAKSAYDSLIAYYAFNPTVEVMNTLQVAATKLSKKEDDVQDDIWKLRKGKMKAATPFKLYNYLTKDSLALTDLQGKVILLTYWFPGCAPCRAEFPSFENVVHKFGRDKVAYVAINVDPEQNPWVIPFVTKNKYSFVPLLDEPAKRGNLITRGQPTNYLLDKNGNIVFSNFRTDSNTEDMLERMIRELIKKS